MAKRRLADLVQEEANKNTVSAQDTKEVSVIDVTATPVEASDEVSPTKVINQETNTEESNKTKAKGKTQESSTQNSIWDSKEESKDETTEGSHLSKADLEVTIQELNEQIAQVRHSEASLQKKVEKLQSALSEQKAAYEVSEKALSEQKAASERSSKELKEAKKTALQLAEANSELTAEIEELKQTIASFEKQKQPQQQKPAALTKAPVQYRKSYGTLDRLQVQPSVEQTHSSNDSSSPMWLLD